MGVQLTQLPPFNPAGLNLRDYATYVRKLTSGGTQDFQATVADLTAQIQVAVATNKPQLRSLNPTGEYQICACLGGAQPNDNQGGWYYTQQSTDVDNDGDRIRPDNFQGLVWFKWLI
jgi:hypothetical protein